jgi:hypothetical protein
MIEYNHHNMLHISAIYLSQTWCLNFVFNMSLELFYVNSYIFKLRFELKIMWTSFFIGDEVAIVESDSIIMY